MRLPCHVEVTGSAEGIERIRLSAPREVPCSWIGPTSHQPAFEAWLKSYLAGKEPLQRPPLTLSGSPFTKRVLQTLSLIPFGHTTTYGQLASAAGRPGAARAVGNVMNRNPFPLLIPCHRVLSSSGLGGFALGLPMKKALLAFEKTCLNR